MKKILSLVLSLCLLMSMASFTFVSADASWTDKVTFSSTGGAWTGEGSGDTQQATTTVADGKVIVTLPAKATTNSRLWHYTKIPLVAAYKYDVEFKLNIKAIAAKDSNVQVQVKNYSKASVLYLYPADDKPHINFNGTSVNVPTLALDTEHTYRIVGDTNTADVYMDGILLASGTAPAGSGVNPPAMEIILNNGADIAPDAQSIELLDFATYSAPQTTARNEAAAALAAEFENASDWEAVKSLIETYQNELFITDSELAEAAKLSQEGVYSALVGGEYAYPGAVAIAFREAVVARAEAEKWTEAFTFETAGGASTNGGEGQSATVNVASGKISVSLPARAANTSRMWHYTRASLVPAYKYDVEFDLNVKNLASKDSNVQIKVMNYAKTNELLLFLAKGTPSLNFNGTSVSVPSLTLDTEHTYRIVGDSNAADLYVDGILIASGTVPSNSGPNTPTMEIILNNGTDAIPDAQSIELLDFATYPEPQTTARNEADAAIAAEFVAAADAESFKALLKEYKDELYLTNAELDDAEMFTQSALYQKLVGGEYAYPGAVTVAFREAVAEQKAAEKWLVNQVSTQGDYIARKDGAIVVDIPSKADLGTETANWNFATIKNDNANAYNFDISFKAQMGENTEYIGLEFTQVNANYNFQIAKNEVRWQGPEEGKITYDDLGTAVHTYRMIGTVSTNANAINPKKINFYIDGKFVGLISPTASNSVAYELKFNFVNQNNSSVTARIWDYKRDTASGKTTLSYTDGYDVLLTTYTPTVTDAEESTSYVIWAAFDEDGRMTSCALSDVVTTKFTGLSVFNLTPPESFVPDYKVKAMYWSGFGNSYIPQIGAVEKVTE